MVSVVSVALLVAVLGFHTLVAAVTTRFFRLRLKTRFGWVVYALTVTPVVLFGSMLVFSGALGIGVDVGHPVLALAIMVGVPLALGITIDVLYVPPPEEYDLPDTHN